MEETSFSNFLRFYNRGGLGDLKYLTIAVGVGHSDGFSFVNCQNLPVGRFDQELFTLLLRTALQAGGEGAEYMAHFTAIEGLQRQDEHSTFFTEIKQMTGGDQSTRNVYSRHFCLKSNKIPHHHSIYSFSY